MANEAQGVKRGVDTHISLSWLIGFTCAIVFAAGGVVVTMGEVSKQIAKLDVKMDQRDERIAAITQNVTTLSGENRMQQSQIDRAYIDINDVKHSIDDIRKGQRWMPR